MHRTRDCYEEATECVKLKEVELNFSDSEQDYKTTSSEKDGQLCE